MRSCAVKKRVVSGQEGDYCTPLIAACIVADLRILRYLLEQGADPNVPRSDGRPLAS
jgi:ankyrin repeat protein